MNRNNLQKKKKIRIGSVIKALCPACHSGKILNGFSIRKHCPKCNLDLYPEPGFYLGAMMVGFLLSAVLTIPPMIILKLMNVDIAVIVAFPFVEFLFVGTFLMFYCRIFWLHLEFQLTEKLDGQGARGQKK